MDANRKILREAKYGLIAFLILFSIFSYFAYDRLFKKWSSVSDEFAAVPEAIQIPPEQLAYVRHPDFTLPERNLNRWPEQSLPEGIAVQSPVTPQTNKETAKSTSFDRQKNSLTFTSSPKPDNSIPGDTKNSLVADTEDSTNSPPDFDSEGPSRFQQRITPSENSLPAPEDDKFAENLLPELPESKSSVQVDDNIEKASLSEPSAINERALPNETFLSNVASEFESEIASTNNNLRPSSDSADFKREPFSLKPSVASETSAPKHRTDFEPVTTSSVKPNDSTENQQHTVKNPSAGRSVEPVETKTTELHEVPYTTLNAETLWNISQRCYGDGRYFRALFEHNAAMLAGKELVPAGTQISCPPRAELVLRYKELIPLDLLQSNQSAGIASESNTIASRAEYTVVEGDTLFSIARERLGQASRYVEIWNLNQSRLGQGMDHLKPLSVGMKLTLPE